MDELNTHQMNINSNEEHSSPTTSLFILEPYSIHNQEDNEIHYQLNAPLCIAQTYEQEFFNHFHQNYYGELEHEGLFVASIRLIPMKINETDQFGSNDEENKEFIRAIIRTMNNNYDVSDIININSEENILQVLFRKAQLSSILSYQIIHHIKANEKLLEFDKHNDEQHSTKLAILFQRSNQTNENEMLSNNQMSIEMTNFLELISERIQLKDFNKYRGDLDIKNNEHGISSYFTIFANHQIMFNIAPLIPSDENDQQYISRKSLIGNALLCIIFQEKDCSFQPDFILSKVTQVYITVEPMEIYSELYYKIQIWRRYDIESIVEPPGGIYKHDEYFRNYFFTLILNTMTKIYQKKFFHLRILDQRQHTKNELIEKLSHVFSSYSNYHDENDSNIVARRKDSSSIDSKHHHIGFIPKIIEGLSNNQMKLNHSISHNDIPLKQHSSTTNTKANPWITHYDKIKRFLSVNSIEPSSHSTNETKSLSSFVNRVIRLENTSKVKGQSSELISSLVTNTVNFVEPNTEKILTNHSNSNTNNEVFTSLPLTKTNSEELLDKQEVTFI